MLAFLSRNLNGFELNGRPLRVDSAAGGDRSADEVQQLQAAFAAQQQEVPFLHTSGFVHQKNSGSFRCISMHDLIYLNNSSIDF